jgi:hypothetical protein
MVDCGIEASAREQHLAEEHVGGPEAVHVRRVPIQGHGIQRREVEEQGVDIDRRAWARRCRQSASVAPKGTDGRPGHTPWNVSVAALAWRCPIATLAVHFDGML